MAGIFSPERGAIERARVDSLAEKWTLYIVNTPKIMPYFHATAVFEVNGTSLEDADRSAGALFRSFRHHRIHFHEYDVTAGAAASPSARTLHFSVIAEFDVDAGSEERAGEMTEEALEEFATDEVQYIAFGLTQGEQRVRPAERPARGEEEPGQRQEARREDGEDEERKERKRSPRGGRGRKRKDERDAEGIHEEIAEPTASATESRDFAQERVEQPAPLREERLAVASVDTAVVVTGGQPQAEPVLTQLEVEYDAPQVEYDAPPEPPPRSSAFMRVTLTMSFRAVELGLQANGDGALDRDEFLARAIAEARSRHPEVPADATPTHEVVVQPWGETVLTLTWAYDVPVPSALADA